MLSWNLNLTKSFMIRKVFNTIEQSLVLDDQKNQKTNSTQNAFVFWRGFFIITIIISFVLLSNFKKIVFTPHYYWGHFHYFEFLSSEVVEAAASLLLLWPQTPLWPLTQLGSAKAVDATAFAEARAHSLNTFRRFGSGRLLTELSIEVGLHH